MKLIHEEAQAVLSKAHDDMTCYADFHRGQAPEYKVGDQVCVRATPKPASSMAHSTVTRALALWAHT